MSSTFDCHSGALRHSPLSRRHALGLLLALSTLSAWSASGDGLGPLPTQPIRLVVGTAAGGVPDILSRSIAQEMSRSTNHAVLVENKVGAGGLLAINYVRGQLPDGSALVLAETGSYAIAPHLTRINPFEESMVPVALLATAPIFLVVNASLGVSTVPELVKLLKANPNMAYGSSGNGSSHHLAMELFKSKTGTQMTHVPYRGASQTALAVVTGEVQVAFLGLNTALPQAKAGKIRILGVASGKRSALLPDAPAIAETVPGYDITVTLGLFAPAATPAGVIRRLNADFTAAAMADVTRERLASSGIESMRTAETPSRYSAIMRKEFQDYGRIVQAAQLKKFD